MLFTQDGCKVFNDSGSVLATGSLVNNMFRLNVAKNENAYSLKMDGDSFGLWHRRFGHASVSKLNLMLNSNVKSSNFVHYSLGRKTRFRCE